jgi:WD40 repeat protein
VVRKLLAAVLILAMGAFGYGVYRYLGRFESVAQLEKIRAPTRTQQVALPGTLIVEQGGALYRLQRGVFRQIANGGWTQPAVTPDHRNLVAVRRSGNVSDLYELDLNGHVQRQLTNDGNPTAELNHWAFYPHVAPDGITLYYSWDQKDPFNNFRVDLTVYAQPLGGLQRQAKPWTVANPYTGGDVDPVGVAGGGIVYTKYDITQQGQTASQLWITMRAMAPGRALTAPQDDCSQPAVSSDGNKVAMICSGGGQVTRLIVAPLTNGVLGPPQVLAQGMIASPAWSGDGNGLVYLAAVQPSGHFQLFYLNTAPPAARAPSSRQGQAATPTAAPATPHPPKKLTVDNDFDATSAPVWF